MLKVEKLRKYFGETRAVDGCSFCIRQGKISALIGPNGSGKTTIFNLILGILKPDSGKIFFGDKAINGLEPQTISNLGISRLFQQSRLFENLTVKENLLLAFDNEDTKFWKNFLGLNKDTREKENLIREKFKLVNLDEIIDLTARHLSCGQKRMVELIRSIIKPHKLLMLDEPIAGLNPELRDKVSQILIDLKNKNETILLIEHDMSFVVNIADVIIVLDGGKVIATGKPVDIMKNRKVIKAYLG